MLLVIYLSFFKEYWFGNKIDYEVDFRVCCSFIISINLLIV